MAKSKSYEMLLKIAGKTDSSLKAACDTAAKNIDALGKTAKNAGKVIAGAGGGGGGAPGGQKGGGGKNPARECGAAGQQRTHQHRCGSGKGRVGL